MQCVKFQKELPGLDTPPWPGELGQRVYENVSGQAWKLWEERMKMILNEYRLMPWQKEAQEIISKQMEDFFFGEGAALPPGYVPQQSKYAGRRSFTRRRPGPYTIAISRSIVNARRACASRSARSTTAGSSPRAKMNPR